MEQGEREVRAHWLLQAPSLTDRGVAQTRITLARPQVRGRRPEEPKQRVQSRGKVLPGPEPDPRSRVPTCRGKEWRQGGGRKAEGHVWSAGGFCRGCAGRGAHGDRPRLMAQGSGVRWGPSGRRRLQPPARRQGAPCPR